MAGVSSIRFICAVGCAFGVTLDAVAGMTVSQ